MRRNSCSQIENAVVELLLGDSFRRSKCTRAWNLHLNIVVEKYSTVGMLPVSQEKSHFILQRHAIPWLKVVLKRTHPLVWQLTLNMHRRNARCVWSPTNSQDCWLLLLSLFSPQTPQNCLMYLKRHYRYCMFHNGAQIMWILKSYKHLWNRCQSDCRAAWQ